VLRGSEEALKRALTLAGRSPGAEPRYPPAETSRPAPPPPLEPEPSKPAPPLPPEPAPAPPPPRATTPAGPEPEPAGTTPPLVERPSHVSEEPSIVTERAEPGAEDGAGAQVTIDQPWDGYAQLSAKEVIARVGESDAAELAAVSLYENANRARQTVLSAVERQLVLATRGGTSD
jgi:hypothetical protein